MTCSVVLCEIIAIVNLIDLSYIRCLVHSYCECILEQYCNNWIAQFI